MNLIQQQDQLKGLSDEQLKAELSNPSGAVPPFLVLTETQRRVDARQSAPGQGKQRGTVAQSLEQQLVSQPSAGLNGSLPQMPMTPSAGIASQMPQGISGLGPQPAQQGYAEGGTVKKKSHLSLPNYLAWEQNVKDLESYGGKNIMNKDNMKYGGPFQMDMKSGADTAGSYNFYAKRMGLPLATPNNLPPVWAQEKVYREGYHPDSLKTLQNLGVDINGTNAYLAHKWGPGSVPVLANAYQEDPNTGMTALLKRIFGAKKGEIAARQNHVENMSVGQELSRLSQKFGDKLPADVNMFKDQIDFGYDANGNPLDEFQNNMSDALNQPQEPATSGLPAYVNEDETAKKIKEFDKILEALTTNKRQDEGIAMARAGYNMMQPSFSAGGIIQRYAEGDKVKNPKKEGRLTGTAGDSQLTGAPQSFINAMNNDMGYNVKVDDAQGGQLLYNGPDLTPNNVSVVTDHTTTPRVYAPRPLPMNVVQDNSYEMPSLKRIYQATRDAAETARQDDLKIANMPWKSDSFLGTAGEAGTRLLASGVPYAGYMGNKIAQSIAGGLGYLFEDSTPGAWDADIKKTNAPADGTLTPQQALDMLGPEQGALSGQSDEDIILRGLQGQPAQAAPEATTASSGGSTGFDGSFEDTLKMVQRLRQPNPLEEKLNASIDKILGREAADREENKGLALATAGFNMMGQGPFFGTAVREGANAGMKAYNEGNAGIDKQQLQNLALLSDLAARRSASDDKDMAIAGGIYEQKIAADSRIKAKQISNQIQAQYGMYIPDRLVADVDKSAKIAAKVPIDQTDPTYTLFQNLPPEERSKRLADYEDHKRLGLIELMRNAEKYGFSRAQKGGENIGEAD